MRSTFEYYWAWVKRQGQTYSPTTNFFDPVGWSHVTRLGPYLKKGSRLTLKTGLFAIIHQLTHVAMKILVLRNIQWLTRLGYIAYFKQWDLRMTINERGSNSRVKLFHQYQLESCSIHLNLYEEQHEEEQTKTQELIPYSSCLFCLL